MPSNSKISSAKAPEPQYLQGLAIVAIVLTVIALIPILYFHVIRIIDMASPEGISQSQGYALLLPGFIALVLSFTLTPLAALIAFIFSIIAIVKSKSTAHDIGIVAVILVVAGAVIATPLLFGW